MAGFFEALGGGLETAGGVLSPNVYDQNQQARRQRLALLASQQQNLPYLLNQYQQLQARQRSAAADQRFQQVISGMSPDALRDPSALAKLIPPDVLAASPAAQNYVDTVGKYNRTRYEERDVPLKGDMIQKQFRNGPSEPWKDVGQPTHKFAKQITIQPTAGASSPLGGDPDFWYEVYDKTGKLPPMAWGAAGNPTREQFLKGFPEWKKKRGGTGTDVVVNQADFRANAGALNAVTKDLNTFEPYKKMLDTNADIAINLGKKISSTDIKLANRPLNWLRQNAMDNPDVAEYLAQMRFVQTEAARVINNPRIVGQLTDESRKEMDAVVSGNAPIDVVERVLNRLKTDGNNRFNAMRSQQSEIIARMKGTTPASSTDQQPTAPKVVNWDDLK